MFPEPFTIGHCVRTVTDDGMSSVESWADAVPVPVMGWSPPGPDDIVRTEQTGVVDELNVYSSKPFGSHRDKLIIMGLEWMVQGGPDDYRFGPFGFTPGARLRCVRGEG